MREFNYKEFNNELFTPEMMNLIAKIHEYKGKQELYFDAKPEILKAMLQVAKIQSTGASNRIEGIYTSDNRLNELVMKKTEPLNRNEQEIAGYREVLSTIHENYEYIAIKPSIILQLHRDLYSYHPTSISGRFKNSDNIIEEVDASGYHQVRFKPLSALDTPEAMERLCNEFQEAIYEEKIDPLLLIAKFVLDFLCIHPFNDGNGRMSRLLTLLLLYQQNYTVGKYISIEMIIENTKESYYETLKQSSQGWEENINSYAPFVKYYLGVILNAYREFSNRIETAAMKGLSKSARVKDIFDRKSGRISKADILTQCPDISMTTIEKALSELVKEKYILKVGSGRATAYTKNHGTSGDSSYGL